jgi:hypothetical protein
LKIDPCKKWECLISKTTYAIVKFNIYNLIIGKIGDVTNGDKKKNTSEI